MDINELHDIFLQSTGICTDTRNIKKGSIFFGLNGKNFNGNEYAKQAIIEGCVLSIVDEDVEGENIIRVDSVLKTLQNLARHHRRTFNIPVIAITGSNGKTTTKELIGAVLQKKYNTLITKGNLNNHLGVPFTLLDLNSSHEIAIIEMGANKPGDIKELVEIAEPTYGIITNIGKAHIEGFGSFEGVLKTKTEMYDFVHTTEGYLFYNADDEILVNSLPKGNDFSYGTANADVIGELNKLDPYIHFSWRNNNYSSPLIKTKLVGSYNFTNFLCAVAMGAFFKVSNKDINQALGEYIPLNNRSQVQKTTRNTLIIDCYNANPTSMRVALESLIQIENPNKFVVLGDMRELGNIAIEEHQSIVEFLETNNLSGILVGEIFKSINTNLPVFNSTEEVLQSKTIDDLANKLILLKGSRGIGLEQLIDSL